MNKKVTGKKICKWCHVVMGEVKELPENKPVKLGICRKCLNKELSKIKHCKND